MTAYYNEIDPFAAAWLRELVKAGHIAPGEVDERSIEDVVPTDLMGYTQCHFFAGIGVWSYALRCAGWPDSRPVWTGSCPCQPFSAAGKGHGFADERHLWPAFFHLIGQCRPVTVFGEQVASNDGLAWLDLVQADLEGTGYTCGAVDTCAAGFGAPHIRQRLYWMADAAGPRYHGTVEKPESKARDETRLRVSGELLPACGLADTLPAGRPERRAGTGDRQIAGSGGDDGLGDAIGTGLEGHAGHGDGARGRTEPTRPVAKAGCLGGMDDAFSDGRSQGRNHNGEHDRQQPCTALHASGSYPTNGFWRDSDWLFCRDGKFRPVESGTSPLAHGAPVRVGRLRGYGNAINARQAEAFIKAYVEVV